jgi:hypothetical protein
LDSHAWVASLPLSIDPAQLTKRFRVPSFTTTLLFVISFYQMCI